MKELFTIIKNGNKNARYFVESMGLKWRQLSLLSLISIIIIALAIFINSMSISNTMISNVNEASQYIPEFEVSSGNLIFSQNTKPVYYQSEYFQMIIDDRIDQTSQSLNFNLPQDKAHQISPDTLVNLFIFRKHAYLLVNQSFLEIAEIHQTGMNKAKLLQFLTLFNQYQWVIYLSLFLTACLFALFNYLLIILIASFLTGIYNVRLSPPIGFRTRLKASVAISFIPIILVECINMLFPLYMGISTSLIIFIIVAIYYIMFKNHTKHILELISQHQTTDES